MHASRQITQQKKYYFFYLNDECLRPVFVLHYISGKKKYSTNIGLTEPAEIETYLTHLIKRT